ATDLDSVIDIYWNRLCPFHDINVCWNAYSFKSNRYKLTRTKRYCQMECERSENDIFYPGPIASSVSRPVFNSLSSVCILFRSKTFSISRATSFTREYLLAACDY